MKLQSRITLACLAALPLAGVVTAQGNNTRGTERTAQEAARAQEEARAKAQEQTQRARDEAARREREAKGADPDARDGSRREEPARGRQRDREARGDASRAHGADRPV